MKLKDILIYSARSIKVQRGRAVLTILGVVIGITAIVALNGLTGGFSNLISGQLSSGLSAQTITVTEGGGGLAGLGFGGGSLGSGPSATLYYDNISGLQENLTASDLGVDHVIGVMTQAITFTSNITGKNKTYT